MSEQGDTQERGLTDAELEKSALMILWFRQVAVPKLGSDKEPTDRVAPGWLVCPLAHLAPDAALDADWDSNTLVHIGFAQRTGLDPGEVLEFATWWDTIGYHSPACVEQINDAMGHSVVLEEPLPGGVDEDRSDASEYM